MNQSNFRHAPPKASAMIEALRGLGYSTATAIADIIDNSVSAGARIIDIGFRWNDASSAISILDDGRGMDADTLDRAMRLGERSPLEERAADDLGRFGLGLKTASFSQCRRLTVASVHEGQTTCLRWDLDLLAGRKDDGWYLYEGPAEESKGFLECLSSRTSGTLVLWEKLDRIVTPGFGSQEFLDLMDNVERHLSMIFHRYLSGAHPKLTLRINGRTLLPWDPFLKSHSATWSSPVVPLSMGGHTATVQAHVLPHKDRLDSQEHETAAGPDGWTSQQGFYVYRNERMLVSGSWLGLGRGRSWTKEEAHRLARIRLDIGNHSDLDWKIDIRKSTARPPVSLREQLTRLAEDARGRARRVFAHRGRLTRTTNGASLLEVWRTEHFSGGVRYRIDCDHPAVKAVLDDAGSLTPQIVAMLRVLEETIPVQRIWLDTAEAKETPRTGFGGESPEAVKTILLVMYRNLVSRKKLSPAEARDQLLCTEPFNSYPELVRNLPDEPAVKE